MSEDLKLIYEKDAGIMYVRFDDNDLLVPSVNKLISTYISTYGVIKIDLKVVPFLTPSLSDPLGQYGYVCASTPEYREVK